MNINEKINDTVKQPLFCQALNKTVHYKQYPKRIISLVPSQTELLYDLDLEEEVVGITKFCIHPNSWFRNKQRIGGTKNINLEKIKALQPDLIIANKEENVKEQTEALDAFAPVYVTDVNNLSDALDMITTIGLLTGKQEKAVKLRNEIKLRFEQLPTTNHQLQTAYLIWRNPYISVGRDTFIHDMLSKCGLINVFEQETRYPTITLEALIAAQPAIVLLSSEPYPFKEQHIEALQQALPNARFYLVDGEMFSWYGSRLLHAPAYFTNLVQQLKS
jgi:ABC-type Fe3+-hydroxamate transport system substrate-binding protein